MSHPIEVPHGFVYIWINNHLDATHHTMYIGQHVGDEYDGYTGSGAIFQKVFNCDKYQGFWFRYILEYCMDQRELDTSETYWIKYYNAVDSDMFCNLREGGSGGKLHHSTIDKIKTKIASLNRVPWNKGKVGLIRKPESTATSIVTRSIGYNKKYIEREKFILDYIDSHIGVKCKQLREMWSVSSIVANKSINKLLSKGMIRQEYFGGNDVRYVRPDFSIDSNIIEYVRLNPGLTVKEISAYFQPIYNVKYSFMRTRIKRLSVKGDLNNKRGYRKNIYFAKDVI